VKTILERNGGLASPARTVKSLLGWRYPDPYTRSDPENIANGFYEVGVHDEQPDYPRGYNEPPGFTRVRSIAKAVCFLMSGRRIAEIHKTPRCEADFQLIFSSKRREHASKEDYGSRSWEGRERDLEMALSALSGLLSKAYPQEISFRFSDLTLLNRGPNG